jgi:hypothetical protein
MQTPSIHPETTDVRPRRSAWLCFDGPQLERCLDKEPFRISHALCDHPLLQLPRLIELATTLPMDSVEYNSGNVPVNQGLGATPGNGLSPTETLRQIETCNSWMVLKNVQQDQAYARLLDECLDSIQSFVERVAPGMNLRRAFIFVSSANATTPYHVDFESNFLLQIRGDKIISVWDGSDRALMSEQERERVIGGGQRNLPYRDEFEAKGQPFHLVPGDGVHVPLSSPHCVKVGDSVSVSLSITFMTAEGFRTRAVHATNAFLRKLGLSPRAAGMSRIGDTLKFAAHRILAKFGSVCRRVGRIAGIRQRPSPPAAGY